MFKFVVLSMVWMVIGQRSQSECPTGNYYDSTRLECLKCPDTNSYAYNSSLCICNSGYGWSKSSQIGFRSSTLCTACTDSTCLCGEGEIDIDWKQTGGPFESKECMKCAENAQPDLVQHMCIPCPHIGMTYSTTDKRCICTKEGYVSARGTCVAQSDIELLPKNQILQVTDVTQASRIQFDQTVVFSGIFTFNYIYSAIGCNVYLSQHECSGLANLCVYQMYDKSALPCQLFNLTGSVLSVVGTQVGNREGMPWLYYMGDPTQVYYDANLKMIMSFDDSNDPSVVHKIPYYLARYQPTGEFVSFKSLASEFILCPHTLDDERNSQSFGINLDISCSMDIADYLNNQQQQYVYELFIKDTDNTYTGVPILIGNYKNTDGSQPNRLQSSFTNYQYTRRFFLIDNLSPREGDYTDPTNLPTLIRYPSQIVFNIRLHKSSDERMYVPFVYINYQYKRVTNGQLDSPIADIQFQVKHNFEPETFWRITTILFIVYNCLIGVIVLVRIYVWTKGNPRRSYYHMNYFTHLFLNIIRLLLDTWNDAMFYFIFVLTGYWFIFYKLQSRIYVLIPSLDDYDNNYRQFEILFYIVFALRLIMVFYLIIKQSNINIFFIDWEKTEIFRPKEIEEDQELLRKAADKFKSKVSVWRTLLVANEFNELQSLRIISVEWTLLFLGLFMMYIFTYLLIIISGLDWQATSQEQPALTQFFPHVPQNYVLKYFIHQLVYLTIGLLQMIIRRLFNIWFPLPVEDFVDLCSMANISIFITDDNLHGYYIHGENSFGFSEGSAEHLQQCLKNEYLDKGKKRGLIQTNYQDQDLQTFEIYIPPKFKLVFEQKNEIRTLGMEELEVFHILISISQQLQKFQLGWFLRQKIQEIKQKHSNYIRVKEPVQRFFNYPPDDIDSMHFNTNNLPYFFRDPDQNFKLLFFCGYELYFLITDILIFSFWLIIVDNTMIAIILQYACTLLLQNLKSTLSESNISNKTKIDERFLI